MASPTFNSLDGSGNLVAEEKQKSFTFFNISTDKGEKLKHVLKIHVNGIKNDEVMKINYMYDLIMLKRSLWKWKPREIAKSSSGVLIESRNL